MIKKEIYMILQNKRFLGVCLVIYVLYSFLFEMDMSFYLPFMAAMMAITGFSYDDYNNWQTYASSLPQGKIGIVRAKFVTAFGSTLLAGVIGFLLSFAVIRIKGTGSLDESLSSLVGCLVAISILLCILLPILFKYGSEKGRMAMYIMGIGLAGAVVVLTRFVKIEISAKLLAFLESPVFPVLIAAVVIVMIAGSYLLSRKIYLKREF